MKIGDRVKLIANKAQSSHKIGDIGHIVQIDASRPWVNYLIEVKGRYDDGGTWSFITDLQKCLEPLNPAIKIL